MVAAADVAMGLNVVVLAALIVVLALLFHNTNEAKTAATNAATTRELAQELRTSSDDLTRFIRTYTVTGNSSYWDYFQEVIKIRDGVSPLPSAPWRIWWDLVISSGAEPRPRIAPSSLTGRFYAAGFTAEELAYLDESKRQSDALIDVEDVASNAMVGKYRPHPPGATGMTPAEKANFTIIGAPNQTWAMELVHSNFYHHWKGEIMRPLDKFAALSSSRVDKDLENINTLNEALLGVLGAAIGILVIIMLLYVFKLRKDQETSQLLNAVLPSHISSAVTPADVNVLREQASAQARMIRRQNAGQAYQDTKGELNDGRFPVLFHEHVPILWISFADVVSFTVISKNASCGAIISMLNELFALMDAACSRFRIVKIKTIGDCFMSVKIPRLSGGGKSKADVKNIARCGLDMLRFLFHAFELVHTIMLPFDDVAAMEDNENPLPRDLELRAGLNAGECASGVVGFDKFMYDVFGDTINSASRYESSGRASHVHTSKQVASLLDEYKDLVDFVPESEGGHRTVNLKGIGEVETVLISGCRPPKNDTGTDQNTQITFAEIHSRQSTAKNSLASANKQGYIRANGP